MKGKLIWTIFWTMVVFFVAIVSTMVSPAIRASMPYFMLTAWIVFAGLGAILLRLTVKAKATGTLKKFLLLTGASAVGFPVFAVLHNVVSGLLNFEEPVFFFLAVIVCPIGFLVGAVGTIVIAGKNRRAN